jgi:hypothetical protein
MSGRPHALAVLTLEKALSAMTKTDRWQKLVRIAVARGTGRGPVPQYVTYVFVTLGSVIICPLYKLSLSDQAQVTLQLMGSPI